MAAYSRMAEAVKSEMRPLWTRAFRYSTAHWSFTAWSRFSHSFKTSSLFRLLFSALAYSACLQPPEFSPQMLT